MKQVTVHLLLFCAVAVLGIRSVVCSATAEGKSTSLDIADNSSSVAVAIIKQRCIQIIETVQSVAFSCTKCTQVVFYFNERNAAICKETWLKNGYFETISLHFPLLPVLSIVVPVERTKWQLPAAINILGNTTNDKMVVIWLESANAAGANNSKKLTEPDWHYHLQHQFQKSKINPGKIMLIFRENTTKFKVSTVTQKASIILLGEFQHELVNVYRMLRINARTMVKTFLFSLSQDINNLNNAIEKAGSRYSHLIYKVDLLSEKLASDLQGNSIRVAGVINKPYQYTDTKLVQLEDGSLEFRPSFAVDTLESLQLAMNFNTIPIKALTWGLEETTKNVTRWVGIIQLLIDQEADLGISSMADSISRREVVKYLFPTSTRPMVVFFKSPGPNNEASLRQPFQLQVWIAILLWTLVVCLLLVLILRREQESYITADIFQQIFSIFSLQYFIQKPIIQITFLRIVIFTGFLMAVVLSSAYVGGLYRFLSSDDDHVKTFQQLEATKFKVGLIAGNLAETFLKLSSVEYEQRILARSTPLRPVPIEIIVATSERSLLSAGLSYRKDSFPSKNTPSDTIRHGVFLDEIYRKFSEVLNFSHNYHIGFSPLEFKSVLDIKYRIMNGSFIMVSTGYALVNVLTSSEMCATRVIPFERKELSEGPVVPKNSQLKRIMDYQLIKFYQVGLVNRWRSLYLRPRTLKPYCSRILAHLEFPTPVPMSTITMALGILGFGFGLALVSIAVEFIRKTKQTEPPVSFQYLK